MDITKIVKAHAMELFGMEEALKTKRLAICGKCPLLKEDKLLGPICNSDLYLNVETNKVSDIELPGFERGCGCRLSAKTRDKDNHCPVGKW